MALDLNKSPYYDDYSEDKLFHRILFKPGVAVQARELTQLQTIIQNQIERFGSHFFKNGSRVLGGEFDPQDPIPFVRVELADSSVRTALVGQQITGKTSGITARVIYGEADDNEDGVSVLFIRYESELTLSGITTSTFEDDEILVLEDASELSITTENSIGEGSIFGISSGVLFIQGFFVKFDSQKISLDQATGEANKKVYFKSEFSTVDYLEDESLKDNAQGFNNYNAPGADRLKCELTLVTSELDEDLTSDDHTLLLEIRDGIVYDKRERTVYNEVYEEIAKRTFDESGDYIVHGWEMFSREHLNNGTNEGWLTASEGGDGDKIAIGIEQGLGYIKGYEVNTLTTRYVEVDKATDFAFVDDQTSLVDEGKNIVVDEIVGLPDPDSAVQINLYDTAENRITNGTIYSDAATGNTVGTAYLSGYTFNSGQMGQSTAQFVLYIHGITLTGNTSFANVRSVGNSNFFADLVLENGKAVLNDSGTLPKLHYVGENYIRSLKDSGGLSDNSIIFARQTAGTLANTGQVTTAVSLGANEILPYGTGTVDSIGKDTIFLTILDNTNTQTLPGDVTLAAGNNTVTGNNTFFTYLNEGDRINIAGSEVLQIASIANNTQLTLTTNSVGSYNGNLFTKYYPAGTIIDLSAKGAYAGTTRTVTSTTSTLSIDIGEFFDTTRNIKLTYKVNRTDTNEIPKNLRPDRYVKIDGSTASSLTKFYLGFSDVYQIKEIRQSNTAFTANTQGTDVTDSFTLFNGQTESSYETSYITTDTAIPATDYLLIRLDYFEPDFTAGLGYFSYDSYPIDDANTSSTTIGTFDIPRFENFDLRNYIDTRPIKQATSTDATTVGAASVNPAASTTWYKDSSGLRSPIPGTNLTYDYSYYFARRDLIVVDQEGTFEIIRGKEAKVPSPPKVPDSKMGLAIAYIPPYPSLSQTYGQLLNLASESVAIDKIAIQRQTMRDLSVLKQRVENLEYYNALTLLEKNTFDLTIEDENGLDRFKNGMFVDPFIDHSLGYTSSADYNVAVSKDEKVMRPTFDVDGFEMGYVSGTGVAKVGDIVTLDYTETPIIERLAVTSTRNVELSSYSFIGTLNLLPNIDTWCDTTKVDIKVLDIDNGIPLGQQITTEWEAPEITKTGAIAGRSSWATVYDEAGRKLGTFNSVNEAHNYLRTQASNAGRLLATNITASDYANSSSPKFKIVTGGSTTIRETVTSNYQGIETTVTNSKNNQELGTFVTDVKLTPYIRPLTIKMIASGLKRNTRYHVFFDGENMNDYITPATGEVYYSIFPRNTKLGIINTDTTVNEDFRYHTLTGEGSEGDALYSDAEGKVYAYLRLPDQNDKRFRVGQKQVVITDSPTNNPEATSYATNYFVASGLEVQKQRTILSTRTLTTETRDVNKTKVQTTTRTKNSPTQTIYDRFTCMAYSFLVEVPDEEEGAFITSADIWIESLPSDLGIWFEIREMSSDGGITRNQVPNSEVWIRSDDSRLDPSNLSTDGINNATRITFNSPVFLYKDVQYAFVIHPEVVNPDTYVWVSYLGENDLVTGQPITSRGLTGTLFTTNNNLNWNIVPDADLKFRLNRASFGGTASVPATGTVNFAVEDCEFVYANTGIPTTFFTNGEEVRGSEILRLSIAGSNTASIGDIVYDTSTTANATIVAIDGLDIYVDGFDFVVGNNFELQYAANNDVFETGTIQTVNFGIGVIDKIDRDNNRFDIIHSNSKFFEGSKLRSVRPDRHKTVRNGGVAIAYEEALSTVPLPSAPTGVRVLPVGAAVSNTTITAPSYTIESLVSYDYTSFTFRPGILEFRSTDASFTKRTVEGTTLGASSTLIPFAVEEFDAVKTLYSASDESTTLSGNESMTMAASLSTTSDYVSPVIDTGLLGGILRYNHLNDDTTDETNATGGNLLIKYISKIITLDDNNTAEDLLILLNEYRPINTNIYVWVRLQSKYDPESIKDKEWFLMESSKTAVSSAVDKRNFIETTYTIPTAMLTGTNGEVVYTSGGGIEFEAFNYFQIKIGLGGTNEALPPKISSLRAIALQI